MNRKATAAGIVAAFLFSFLAVGISQADSAKKKSIGDTAKDGTQRILDAKRSKQSAEMRRKIYRENPRVFFSMWVEEKYLWRDGAFVTDDLWMQGKVLQVIDDSTILLNRDPYDRYGVAPRLCWVTGLSPQDNLVDDASIRVHVKPAGRHRYVNMMHVVSTIPAYQVVPMITFDEMQEAISAGVDVLARVEADGAL